MRIGILTCWSSSDNYGQQMQMYALQHFLRSKGYDAFLIRYAPMRSLPLSKRIIKTVKSVLKPPLAIFIPKLRRNIEKEKELNRLKEVNQKLNQKRNFKGFHNSYIHTTHEVYTSFAQLKANPPQADVYITGSDQVWHDPLWFEGAPGWFLNFGSQGVKRIAYAASIGREIKKEEEAKFAKMLSWFDAISVREDSAKEQCTKAGYVQVELTIDPTLLMKADSYESLWKDVRRVTEKPYLFMYILNVATTEETGWPLIEPYIKQKGWTVKNVSSSGYMPARELIPNSPNLQATIPEWLALINDAKAVITTSFHGMVFSIQMHKPFLAILLTNENANANVRITYLLHQIGLESRILDFTKPMEEQMDAPIDWKAVEQKLASLRQSSIEFLLGNILRK